jgi:hypothetical protein
MNLTNFLAKACCYAQGHIVDAEAWDEDPAERGDRLQCTSYMVACFLAQNTVRGDGGVEREVVIDKLVEHPMKSEEEWARIIEAEVEELGGWKAGKPKPYMPLIELTEDQIKILERFFLKRENTLPSEMQIAYTLLRRGRCVVAGDGCIWTGDAGNFIRVTPAPDAVGCSLLELDLSCFLRSGYVQALLAEQDDTLIKKRDELNEQRAVIRSLMTSNALGGVVG